MNSIELNYQIGQWEQEKETFFKITTHYPRNYCQNDQGNISYSEQFGSSKNVPATKKSGIYHCYEIKGNFSNPLDDSFRPENQKKKHD